MIDLRNTDCLDLLKSIGDYSVDLILQDPPYNTTQCDWEYDIDLPVLWQEWERVLKPNGVILIFSDEPFTSRLIMSRLGFFKYRITWDKMQGSNFLNAHKMPLKQTEDIVMFSKVKNGEYTYNPILKPKPKQNIRPMGKPKDKKKSTYGEHKGEFADGYDNTKSYPTNLIKFSGKADECNPLNRWHPTQKPVGLLNELILTFSNENDLVFDGYSGSGSTAISCHKTKRRFIGAELNEEYYEKAIRRIKNETAQLTMW